ncbi:hypothetical protein [Gluconacetobacter diazotrophicus]|uniref:Putative membrane protein n=1 Tax=Gluconacetobacter diazotrophicus (strain ATCC 49037 / DSM 5601 / CCUG 37298 / CIP 103539 / LMG 7603 / PAl5) TaxID=272568 RepID=A9HQN8_GLUDA|nr:hypothetical protein [Gluconacetobacter diazotrophicus]CAP56771.1 putative membrane protein [Gluconacetobacter diazotrophicus PA1 5]
MPVNEPTLEVRAVSQDTPDAANLEDDISRAIAAGRRRLSRDASLGAIIIAAMVILPIIIPFLVLVIRWDEQNLYYTNPVVAIAIAPSLLAIIAFFMHRVERPSIKIAEIVDIVGNIWTFLGALYVVHAALDPASMHIDAQLGAIARTSTIYFSIGVSVLLTSIAMKIGVSFSKLLPPRPRSPLVASESRD